MPCPATSFETWLFQQVAGAVEENEVTAMLLTGLHAVLAGVRARPPEPRAAGALMDLAERVHLPLDHLTALLATLEA